VTTIESVTAGVKATIAAQAHAQDDGRTDDLAALYTEDAVIVVPGVATLEGRDAIWKAFEEWKPRAPQRHMVTNILVTEFDETSAKATSDVTFVQKGEDGWSIQIVGRYFDTFRLVDGTWLFSRREDEF
jgi:ketosteroid isomerase-like protein